jgi:hypothetical protein
MAVNLPRKTAEKMLQLLNDQDSATWQFVPFGKGTLFLAYVPAQLEQDHGEDILGDIHDVVLAGLSVFYEFVVDGEEGETFEDDQEPGTFEHDDDLYGAGGDLPPGRN